MQKEIKIDDIREFFATIGYAWTGDIVEGGVWGARQTVSNLGGIDYYQGGVKKYYMNSTPTRKVKRSTVNENSEQFIIAPTQFKKVNVKYEKVGFRSMADEWEEVIVVEKDWTREWFEFLINKYDWYKDSFLDDLNEKKRYVCEDLNRRRREIQDKIKSLKVEEKDLMMQMRNKIATIQKMKEMLTQYGLNQ